MHLTLVACVSATLVLSACSNNADALVVDSAPQTTKQDAAALSAKSDTAAARESLEQIGISYADALIDSGLTMPPMSSNATLAQIARGICSQLAAGTSESEIREQLRPFTLYAVSQSGGELDEKRAEQTYLAVARDQICDDQ